MYVSRTGIIIWISGDTYVFPIYMYTYITGVDGNRPLALCIGWVCIAIWVARVEAWTGKRCRDSGVDGASDRGLGQQNTRLGVEHGQIQGTGLKRRICHSILITYRSRHSILHSKHLPKNSVLD